MEVLGIVLLVAIGGLSATVFIVSVVAHIWDWILAIRYLKYNGYGVSNGLTGRQLAENMLNSCGLNDVKVEKCGFFRMIFFGNSYSHRKKTVFLRGNIIDSSSLTATAIASQRVALAILDKDGDNSYRKRSRYEATCALGALSFLPIILVGALMDWITFSELGYITIIAFVIAFIFFGYSIFGECMVIKSDDKANAKAIEMLVSNNLVNEAEIPVVQKYYRTDMTRHILKFILLILEFIKLIFRVLLKFLKLKLK